MRDLTGRRLLVIALRATPLRVLIGGNENSIWCFFDLFASPGTSTHAYSDRHARTLYFDKCDYWPEIDSVAMIVRLCDIPTFCVCVQGI